MYQKDLHNNPCTITLKYTLFAKHINQNGEAKLNKKIKEKANI